MTFQSSRLIGTIGGAVIACLFFGQGVSAQTVYYSYPVNSYGWNYVSQPTSQPISQASTRYYSAPRTTSYRSTPRPAGGYGANLHRNFTIRQEQLRSQRTGQPVRNRGNVRWVR